jgi:hypothetical protein
MVWQQGQRRSGRKQLCAGLPGGLIYEWLTEYKIRLV